MSRVLCTSASPMIEHMRPWRISRYVNGAIQQSASNHPRLSQFVSHFLRSALFFDVFDGYFDPKIVELSAGTTGDK